MNLTNTLSPHLFIYEKIKPFGLPVKLEELPDFLASGACLLYYPIEWLLTSALKDLTSRLDELSPPGNQSSVLE